MVTGLNALQFIYFAVLQFWIKFCCHTAYVAKWQYKNCPIGLFKNNFDYVFGIVVKLTNKYDLQTFSFIPLKMWVFDASKPFLFFLFHD